MTILAAIHNRPPNVPVLGTLATAARGLVDPRARELRRIDREHKAALQSIARIVAEAEAEMDSLACTQPPRRTNRRGRR